MKDIGTWLRERTLDEKVEDIDWVMEVSKHLGKVELLKELDNKSSINKKQIAYNLSKEYVKKFLDYPKIVRFPKIKESKDNIIDLGSGRYKIDGELEYELADEIVYHTHYVCILINKGQNRWILESIQVYDKEPAIKNE